MVRSHMKGEDRVLRGKAMRDIFKTGQRERPLQALAPVQILVLTHSFNSSLLTVLEWSSVPRVLREMLACIVRPLPAFVVGQSKGLEQAS